MSTQCLNVKLMKPLVKMHNMAWECRLGIHSRGIVFTRKQMDYKHYATSPYSFIMQILHSLNMVHSDVFVDIGCGKGRVLCCASRFEIEKVIGVEVDNDLYKIARQNVRKARGTKSSVQIIHASAIDFDFRIGTIYYLFDTYGESSLSTTLAKMKESLKEHPRPIRIVYVNPVHEAVLRKSDWLQMYDKWQAGKRFGFTNDVSFWRTAIDSQT
jgi:cyclopropane fatty-acyl-phospholipid synthase-like methyltransferase